MTTPPHMSQNTILHLALYNIFHNSGSCSARSWIIYLVHKGDIINTSILTKERGDQLMSAEYLFGMSSHY